ncbi:WD40 repeat-like protein [Ophiobolus disseminans]|uniref:WD40 repeat-like protein n=1 Tax=Ophiobolus disseminans TaxID=1469910 RepID=A0A6A6ZUK4_9PLEO|nr:WD40 repeat-like protein [Ophiobolus disseminans]
MRVVVCSNCSAEHSHVLAPTLASIGLRQPHWHNYLGSYAHIAKRLPRGQHPALAALPSMESGAHWELPSLKATIKLGGQSKVDLSFLKIYDVEFYPYTLPGADPVFAVCGGSHVIVCRCVLEKNRTIEILFWPENEQKETPEGELIYANSVTWSQAENGDPLLCVTGSSAREINIFNIATKQLVTTLTGHGDDINDLAVSPVNPIILASCSVDHSVRIWSLDPAHEKKPLAAICYGQGHKDQILTLAYHRSGRFILSAGMDTKVNLWTVPEDLEEHMGTDKPAMIHYPHFSTTEVHTDFVDCVQWYNDLIFSHAARENKIILWKIDGFSSDSVHVPNVPVPISNAVTSRTPLTTPVDSSSGTRSAWGGRFQRLLQFELPNTMQFYIRFSIFHELGRHPILVAGNEKSKAFFWDLERLENAGTGEDANEPAYGKPFGLLRQVREGSSSSIASSAVSTGSGTTKAKRKKVKEPPRDQGVANPFLPIKAHKIIEVPKYTAFPFRHFAWSRDGQWCVGAGDSGLINVFHRWEKGVPPIKPDSDLAPFLRQQETVIS